MLRECPGQLGPTRRLAAAHTYASVSGQTTSWYTHEGGIKAFAANGPVSLRAHTDELQILADKDVTVISVNDEIRISASTRIEIVGGQSSLVLDGADMLFESIVKPAVSDPIDVEEFMHIEPYDPLLDAVYTADTPEEASAFVKKYLDGWYKAFDGVPWHNGHLVVTDECSNEEGHWAFEAAAVCVTHAIDDTGFRDHRVYPKDLADWARQHKVIEKIKPQPGAQALRLRCEAKQPCPQSGYRVHARQGQEPTSLQGQPGHARDCRLALGQHDLVPGRAAGRLTTTRPQQSRCAASHQQPRSAETTTATATTTAARMLSDRPLIVGQLYNGAHTPADTPPYSAAAGSSVNPGVISGARGSDYSATI